MLSYCFNVNYIVAMIDTLKNVSLLWIVVIAFPIIVGSIIVILLLSIDSDEITSRVEIIINSFGCICISIPIIIISVLIIIEIFWVNIVYYSVVIIIYIMLIFVFTLISTSVAIIWIVINAVDGIVFITVVVNLTRLIITQITMWNDIGTSSNESIIFFTFFLLLSLLSNLFELVVLISLLLLV